MGKQRQKERYRERERIKRPRARALRGQGRAGREGKKGRGRAGRGRKEGGEDVGARTWAPLDRFLPGTGYILGLQVALLRIVRMLFLLGKVALNRAKCCNGGEPQRFQVAKSFSMKRSFFERCSDMIFSTVA